MTNDQEPQSISSIFYRAPPHDDFSIQRSYALPRMKYGKKQMLFVRDIRVGVRRSSAEW